MPSDAPSASAFASLSSLDDVAMTRAPAAFANCRASIETPPVPSTSTVSPARVGRPACISACHAVTPAQGRHAACSNDKPSGTAITPSSYNTTCSASMPSSGEPSAARAANGGPPGGIWLNRPMTRSPGLNARGARTDGDDLTCAVRERNRVARDRTADVDAERLRPDRGSSVRLHARAPAPGPVRGWARASRRSAAHRLFCSQPGRYRLAYR